VRAFDHGIEAERFGAADQLQIVAQTLAHIFARRVLSANDQAQLHPPPPVYDAKTLSSDRRGCKLAAAAGMGGRGNDDRAYAD
jgi:hypothetical protein